MSLSQLYGKFFTNEMGGVLPSNSNVGFGAYGFASFGVFWGVRTMPTTISAAKASLDVVVLGKHQEPVFNVVIRMGRLVCSVINLCHGRL